MAGVNVTATHFTLPLLLEEQKQIFAAVKLDHFISLLFVCNLSDDK